MYHNTALNVRLDMHYYIILEDTGNYNPGLYM